IGVVRKGSRALQYLPASPDAFVWLRLYQHELEGLVPKGPGEPLWWTLRRPFRTLVYDAARMVFTKANAALGANWTLHDLRHSALGEVAAIETTLAAAEQKLDAMRAVRSAIVHLGMPDVRSSTGRAT